MLQRKKRGHNRSKVIGGVTVGDMVRLLGEGKRVEDMENNRGMQVGIASAVHCLVGPWAPHVHADMAMALRLMLPDGCVVAAAAEVQPRLPA